MRTKYTFLLLASFVIFFASHSIGQSTIIGKITDSRTGEPLSDVKVSWLGGGDMKKELSNEEGIYQISYISKSMGMISILSFELPGKKTKFVSVNDFLLDSLFYEIDVQLEEREISSSTASHWEQSVYEIPASTVIISRDEIERNGYMTLNEILENVPGFYTIDHRSESDITLGVRGFWAPFNRNVLIQVNGVNMLSERQNDFAMNKINVSVESIERIEIVRGPLSIIYGAGAFFGVINIITLDPLGEEVSGHISSGWGTQNNFTQNFRYGLHKDGLMLSLNAMNFMRDGFEQPWDAMITDSLYDLYASTYSNLAPFDTTTADQYQGLMTNPERYSKRHQSVNFAMRYNKFTANLNYARSNFGFSFLHPGPQDRNDYQSNTINIQFGYAGESAQYDWKGGKSYTQFSYELKAAHMASLVDATYKYFLPDSYTPGEDRVATLRTEANSLWTIYNNRQENKSLMLSSGFAYNNNYRNHSLYNAAEFGLRNWYIGLAPNTSLQTTALYSQLDAKFDEWQFVAGARMEKQGSYEMLSIFNQDYNFVDILDTTAAGDTTYFTTVDTSDINDRNNQINFIPRLAVLYKFWDHDSSAHYLRLMYGGALKQSSVVDNASDVMLASATTGQFIPYLRPERIRTYEIGYTYNYATEDYKRRSRKSLMINVNAFRNDLFDLITRNAAIVNGTYVTSSSNGDELTTNGIELITSAEYSIPRSSANQKSLTFSLKGDVTYQRTKDARDPEFEVSFSPDLLAGATASFEVSAPRIVGEQIKVRSFAVSVGMNYVGEMKAYYQPDTTGTTANPVAPYYIGEDTEGYARWSCNFRINDVRFFGEKRGGFYLNARVSNIFNKQYLYPTYDINSWATRGMLGRPRQILVTVGYKF